LGDLYQQIGQFAKAKLYLNKSLQISPNHGETYFFKGEIAARQGDTTTALQYFHQTLNLKPTFLPLYLKFAEVYTALRQYDLALFYSDEGIKQHPKNAELYYKKGLPINVPIKPIAHWRVIPKL
jgi:tetratricopeptide (TPR) repeat protein